MKKDFEIIFCAGVDFEELTVEIRWNNRILCRLDKEKGKDNLEIEFFFDSYDAEGTFNVTFPLQEFLEVIKISEAELLEA